MEGLHYIAADSHQLCKQKWELPTTSILYLFVLKYVALEQESKVFDSSGPEEGPLLPLFAISGHFHFFPADI